MLLIHAASQGLAPEFSLPLYPLFIVTALGALGGDRGSLALGGVTRARSHLLLVVALTALGAVLRFPTLDRQSFWLDELVTVSLLDHGLGDVLREVPRTEATPFLYYVVAWAWGSLFGLGEVGIRTLSALAGTATIPVAYGAGAVLVSRRAGRRRRGARRRESRSSSGTRRRRGRTPCSRCSAPGRCSPSGTRCAGRGGRSWPGGSSLPSRSRRTTTRCSSSARRLAWLLVRVRPRRPVVLASLVPVATLVVHVPLLLEQRGNGEAVTGSSLVARIAGIPKNLVVGYSFPAEALGSALAALLVLVGLVLLVRLAPAERRGALVAGSLAAAVILIPVVLAVAGEDYLIAQEHDRRGRARGGVPRRRVRVGRLGLAAAAVLCVLSAGIALAPALDTSYGRTDWRGAAEAGRDDRRARARSSSPRT